MRKLLVLFPGVGYSTARPLLYYAKRMGQEKGYEVLELEYRRMPEHPFDNLKETAKTVCACAEAWAEHVDWEKYDKIAFVSKSVGTVAAGFLTRRLAETGGCVQIVNLFLTPIEPTLKYLTEAKNGTKMGSSQIVFSGTADQWMEPELLADFCRKHGIEHHAYSGGNHSIETGHVLRDVEIAKEIVGFYEKLL
ncbi:hypothetical protein DWZ97_04375 [Firmicutes bacterium AF36-19BH]|nr:hypothetical protein DWZ97_04375 [Firmicutes bacterium AF36-19BH]